MVKERLLSKARQQTLWFIGSMHKSIENLFLSGHNSSLDSETEKKIIKITELKVNVLGTLERFYSLLDYSTKHLKQNKG